MYIPLTSRPYLFIPIDGLDPEAGATVEIAVIADDGTEPRDTDYHPAPPVTPAPGADPEPAILLGPGGDYSYPAGYYFAFARLTAGAERLVLPAGRVRIGEPPG